MAKLESLLVNTVFASFFSASSFSAAQASLAFKEPCEMAKSLAMSFPKECAEEKAAAEAVNCDGSKEAYRKTQDQNKKCS